MKRLYVFILIALAWVSIASADLLDGLVLYMPLDEGAGKKITGLSENAFEGEIQGNAKWVDGKFGKALEFSASSDKVFIDDAPVFHIEDEITQAAWINLDRLPSAHAIIFGTRSGGGRNIGFGYGITRPRNDLIRKNFRQVDDSVWIGNQVPIAEGNRIGRVLPKCRIRKKRV